MTVKEIRKGEFFTLKAIAEPGETQVWVRGSYDPTERKFLCWRYDDINCFRLLSGRRQVFTEFVF